MKKLIALIILLFSNEFYSQSPIFGWADKVGGNGNDVGNSIITDGIGNVYSTGNFTGTVDFDPGMATYNLTSGGANDVFVIKLDQLGNLIWAKQILGNGNDVGASISLDNSGNPLITGSFGGVADFDPSISTFTLSSNGQSDIFILKLDSNGNLIWVKQIGGGYVDVGLSITHDTAGNVYSTGEFASNVDFDPGIGTFTLSANINGNIFVSKLDFAGNFVWAKQMGATTGGERGLSIDLDASGNVYTTGYFGLLGASADFDPGPSTFNLTPFGGWDIFISKLDASGNFVWVKQLGGGGNEWATSIKIDPTGNILTTGTFQGTADFNPGIATFNLNAIGNYNVFVSKLDLNGNFTLAKQLGGMGNNIGYSINTDNSSNIYTTGYFQYNSDFDPGPTTFTMTPFGSVDAFISKLDALGNFSWAQQIGGSSSTVIGNAITTDTVGNLYLTGEFDYSIDCDPSASTFSINSTGGKDVWLLKLASGTAGVMENEIRNPILVFPNPATNNLNFSSEEFRFIGSKIDITNSLGQTVLRTTFKNQIDVSELPNGFYFLKLKTESGQEIIKKVVISK